MTISDPLLPANVDLRDFPFMPMDIGRLFDSEFHALANDGEWRAGVTLWLKSFHQVPAASIPDDDVALARLAEFGRDVKSWRKVRALALRGWVKASDGRLYHPVVAEKALEAWVEKLGQRKTSIAGNAKRWGGEADTGEIDGQIDTARRMLTALNPESRVLRKRLPKASRSDPVGTPGGTPDRTASRTPDVIPSGSQETGTGTGIIDTSLRSVSLLPETALSGASEVQGGQASEEPKPKGGRRSYPKDFEQFWQAYPTDANMSKTEAHDAWKKLDEADRQAAIASVPGFKAYCKQHPDYRPIYANRYLARRRFEGHQPRNAEDRASSAAVSLPDETWRTFVGTWKTHRSWPLKGQSEPPDHPDTLVPVSILLEFGIPHQRAA